MDRTPITLSTDAVPATFRPFVEAAAVFDSSCSHAARVWFLDKGPGFYLKVAPKGTLQKEAAMTRFFHTKGLAAEVIACESLESDWLLTTRVPGEDCLAPLYMDDPIRLCDTLASLLRKLHSTDHTGCPVPNRTAEYLATARRHYAEKRYDPQLFPDNWGYDTPEEAFEEIKRNGKYLKTDTLLHGDYCLPNIILDNWRFGGFIDLDAGGVGDRHVDLFWAIWSLQFNLKTDRYRDRFLDAYGREDVCEDSLRTVAAAEVFG